MPLFTACQLSSQVVSCDFCNKNEHYNFNTLKKYSFVVVLYKRNARPTGSNGVRDYYIHTGSCTKLLLEGVGKSIVVESGQRAGFPQGT